jgi:hypothetical protein
MPAISRPDPELLPHREHRDREKTVSYLTPSHKGIEEGINRLLDEERRGFERCEKIEQAAAWGSAWRAVKMGGRVALVVAAGFLAGVAFEGWQREAVARVVGSYLRM